MIISYFPSPLIVMTCVALFIECTQYFQDISCRRYPIHHVSRRVRSPLFLLRGSGRILLSFRRTHVRGIFQQDKKEVRKFDKPLNPAPPNVLPFFSYLVFLFQGMELKIDGDLATEVLDPTGFEKYDSETFYLYFK